MATDDFNRANNSGVGALGANWTEVTATGKIQSNQAGGNGGGNNALRYSGTSFNSDHYAQCLLTDMATGYLGPSVRMASGSVSYYWWLPSSGQVRLLNSGSETTIASGLTVPVLTDTIKLEANGSNLTRYINGVQSGSPTSDGTLSGGGPGFACYANADLIDDWEGADLAAGSSASSSASSSVSFSVSSSASSSVSSSASSSPSPSAGPNTFVFYRRRR